MERVEKFRHKGQQEVLDAQERVSVGVDPQTILLTKWGLSYLAQVSIETLKDWRLRVPPYGPTPIAPDPNNYMDNKRIATKYRYPDVLSFIKERSSAPEVRTALEQKRKTQDAVELKSIEIEIERLKRELAELNAKYSRIKKGNATAKDLTESMAFLIQNDRILAPCWGATDEQWDVADDMDFLEPMEALEAPWLLSEAREEFTATIRLVVEQVSNSIDRLALLAETTKVDTKKPERF